MNFPIFLISIFISCFLIMSFSLIDILSHKSKSSIPCSKNDLIVTDIPLFSTLAVQQESRSLQQWRKLWKEHVNRLDISNKFQNQLFNEKFIESFINISSPLHEIMIRYPLPAIPVFIQSMTGHCLLGPVCDTALKGRSSWSPDPHIRDGLISSLLPCVVHRSNSEEPPCLMIDVGSNMGAHSLAALQMGVHVIGIEPQLDLCVSSRISARYIGASEKSHFICGAVSVSLYPNHNKEFLVGASERFRYGGTITSLPYALPNVPFYPFDTIIPQQANITLLKIDTDSIDCAVLSDALNLILHKNITIAAISLETWDSSCISDNLIGNLLVSYRNLGFDIYRTLVYERSWDNNGWDVENNFQRVDLPFGWIEKFNVGLNFVLWYASSVISDEILRLHPTIYPNWQYLLLADKTMIQTGYRTKEL